MSTYVDVSCNNPDNGIFANKAPFIQIVFNEEIAEFEASNWCHDPKFVETNEGFRLAGKNWPTTGSKEWVGNWCWNRYHMTAETFREFLEWMQNRKVYVCSRAETQFYDWFKTGGPLPSDNRAYEVYIDGELRATTDTEEDAQSYARLAFPGQEVRISQTSPLRANETNNPQQSEKGDTNV